MSRSFNKKDIKKEVAIKIEEIVIKKINKQIYNQKDNNNKVYRIIYLSLLITIQYKVINLANLKILQSTPK